MFLQRADILRQKIQLFRLFSEPKSYELLNSLDKSLDKDILIVKEFFKKDISNFATPILHANLKKNLIDYEFLDVLLEFDQEKYEKEFFKVLKENNLRYNLESIEKMFPSHQAVLFFEFAYQQIDAMNTKEYNEFTKALVKLHSRESYSTLSTDLKERVAIMFRNVSVYIKYIRNTPGVVISNLANGQFLQIPEIVNNYHICFGPRPTSLEIHDENEAENEAENEDENDYEIRSRYSDEWVYLCLLRNKFNEMSAAFCQKCVNPTKWTIVLYDPQDTCKGYLIKAKEDNVYLCSELGKGLVVLKETMDETQYVDFTWKFELRPN